MNTFEHVTLDRRDGVAVLTLNRPDRRNAYSLKTVAEVHAICDQLDGDLGTRVLILTGAGPAFCAGIDLKEGVDTWPEKVGVVQARYRLQQRLASMVLRLREIPQPVIAAVRGPAVGGGLALAAAADIRVADVTARFNAAFIRIGLSGGDDGASWLLPRLVGPSAAAEILYTGRFVDATEALRIGLVSRVVAEGEHVAAAEELAAQIMQNSPFGVRMTKELLNFSLDAPALRQAMELENRTQVLCLLTDDFEEGTRAFAERRRADYADR
ncbi:MAG: enoyl-CoA hydratase/isomerase family protein [Actinophytocola sp.]|uniref:enoyl-CoA hydratase/isomerase family protein n=1 Tax=Actinophytocola sp. TaxID=1872138 RepID=UPI00132A058B|nr:enoyl-CoA hydratase/isomerase family protein [Actinophytocola sp.]MPZ83535.1 enoyl-CoA hydratase/isomerase family protein [Actinophytocola sp.]